MIPMMAIQKYPVKENHSLLVGCYLHSALGLMSSLRIWPQQKSGEIKVARITINKRVDMEWIGWKQKNRKNGVISCSISLGWGSYIVTIVFWFSCEGRAVVCRKACQSFIPSICIIWCWYRNNLIHFTKLGPGKKTTKTRNFPLA